MCSRTVEPGITTCFITLEPGITMCSKRVEPGVTCVLEQLTMHVPGVGVVDYPLNFTVIFFITIVC